VSILYIYLDESGDLGFDFSKPKTTKHFVVTALVCQEQSVNVQFEKAVRRTLKNKLNRKKGKRRHELKGTSTTLAVKTYFYHLLKMDGWQLYTLVLDKQTLAPSLKTHGGKHRLYNHLSRHLLEQLPLQGVSSNVRLVIDRSKNIGGVQDFNTHVKNHLEAMLPLNTAFHIEHQRSEDFAGLQAVDLFCWGVFRKYELSDSQWYSRFADRITTEIHIKKAAPAAPV
jgi:hypothetical protein